MELGLPINLGEEGGQIPTARDQGQQAGLLQLGALGRGDCLIQLLPQQRNPGRRGLLLGLALVGLVEFLQLGNHPAPQQRQRHHPAQRQGQQQQLTRR